MPEGGAIVNTTSVTAYQGNPALLDYSATKGAIVAFTRALSKQLLQRGIRVNGVAPGPIWTPLIPASYPPEKTAKHGTNAPMGRPGQPDEVAPCYIFLASEDASYMSGQILHPNGGTGGERMTAAPPMTAARSALACSANWNLQRGREACAVSFSPVVAIWN